MTKREAIGAGIAVLITLAVTMVWDFTTDRLSRGQDAVTADLVNDILDERLRTDSGKSVHQVLAELNNRSIENATKLDIIVDAVEALSE